jgi:hypothetical protein
VKLPLVLGVALLSAGCRFWYKPVPVANAIGEERTILAGDSVSVYRDSRFEVYGPNAEAVYDGYEQMNRAYRAFERHFGSPAPRLAFVLYPDTIVPMDSGTARSIRGRGYTIVPYARPRSVRTRRRYSSIDYGGIRWPIAPTAARSLLARVAASAREGGADQRTQQNDAVVLERLPAWYRAAVIHLVGEAGAFENDLDYLREKRSQWWPFRDMMTLVRPPTADSLFDPSLRGDADDASRIFASQSSALARYLSEREGATVVGRIGRGYLAGRSFNEMMSEFKSAPRNAAELERRWRIWIDTRED